MRVNFSKLKTLPVITESGQIVGHVKDLELDIDGLNVSKLIVSPGWLKNELLIAPNQVVKITAEKIVVSDNTSKEAESIVANAKLPENAATPVIESEIQE